MSKYRFKSAEKWAVWKTHGENCRWCNIPVFYPHCQIDHVLPESLPSKDFKAYNRLKKLYKLHSDFEINSFYNWIPIHSGCNQSKSDDVFDGAPFVGQLLNRIKNKFSETTKWYNSMKNSPKQAKVMATIAQAVEDGILKESDLMEIFNSVKDPNQATTEMTVSAVRYGFGRYDNSTDIKFEINNFQDCTNLLNDYTLTQQSIIVNPIEKKLFDEVTPGILPDDLHKNQNAQKIEWLNKIVNITDHSLD